MKRDFQTELREAQPRAEHIAATLCQMGIEHKAIDWQRAGLNALVESSKGVHLGDLISMGIESQEQMLRDVRHSLATAVARGALDVVPGGHINHITEFIPFSTANWMCEIHFDYDESRYALVGEWIVPTENTLLGWVRDYRLYQAKTDSRCDVPGCGAAWYQRNFTRHDHVVHICRKHQEEQADPLWTRLHPAQVHGGA